MSKFTEFILNEFMEELLENETNREWVLQTYKNAKKRALKLTLKIDEERYKKITVSSDKHNG